MKKTDKILVKSKRLFRWAQKLIRTIGYVSEIQKNIGTMNNSKNENDIPGEYQPEEAKGIILILTKVF